MILNDLGRIVVDAWNDLPNHYPYVALDAFVVMPDPVHGIVVVTDGRDRGMDRARRAGWDSRGDRGPRPHGLPETVRAFKSFSARRIHERRGTPGGSRLNGPLPCPGGPFRGTAPRPAPSVGGGGVPRYVKQNPR